MYYRSDFTLRLCMFLFCLLYGPLNVSQTFAQGTDANPSNTTEIKVEVCKLEIEPPARKGDLLDGYCQRCTTNDTQYGCIHERSERTYKYGNENPVTLDIEQEYLPNVLPQEAGEMGRNQVSLEAIAIAARSYAHHKINNPSSYIAGRDGVDIDNSTQNQAFIPDVFESNGGYWVQEAYKNDVCADPSILPVQKSWCDALENVYYLTMADPWDETHKQWNGTSPIFAEFSADIKTNTNENTSRTVDNDAPASSNNRPYRK